NQRRDYFAVIRKAIAEINASFEKLGITELVPLPDVPEILVDYRELLGHELAGRSEIFIGRLGREYSVATLLNGIESEASRRNAVPQTIINVQGDYFSQSRVIASEG